MSAATAVPVNEDQLIKEMIDDLDADLKKAKTKEAAAKPKPRTAGAAKYAVYASLDAAEAGAPAVPAPSVDTLLASFGAADASADIISLQLHIVKPYGTAFLAKPVASPAAGVLKKLAKTLNREAPLKGAAAPKEADFSVMLKPGKKIEKKAKAAAKASEKTDVHKRIKANLDKLKEKEKKAGAKKAKTAAA